MITERSRELPALKVPEHAIRRLSLYLRYLYGAKADGAILVSAPAVARVLPFEPTQIVKDIALTGIKGKTRNGYNTIELIRGIESYLNFNPTRTAFLVGTGNLGSALMTYRQLESFGLRIVAGFDTDASKWTQQVDQILILPIEKFGEMASQLKVEIGIITTPEKVAQQVADLMIENGIKAIWNFAPVLIHTPENIIVQHTSMYSNVSIMLKKLEILNQL